MFALVKKTNRCGIGASPRWAASALMVLLCSAAASAADFGVPPSGEIPILFNDHTVYAKPDVLVRGRVLAAMLKDGQIYVPLRSMFEQMGATVSASADGKTVTAVKPGSSVSVTLGKAEVVVNGETRPLDVPPMVLRGIVLVPVRVISEGLGAYVQWVPARRVVVVRYIPVAAPATPAPPTPAPIVVPVATPAPIVTAPPTVAPTPAPTVTPSYQAFVQAAFSAPNNYNEYVAGGYCDSYLINVALAPRNSAFALKADFRHDSYVTSNNVGNALGNRFTQFATLDGGTAFTPVFLARQDSLDLRAELKIAPSRLYVGAGYLRATNNYGGPNLSGWGAGIEKLPELNPGLSFYGSAFYYPSASGNYTVSNPASPNNGTTYRVRYAITKYDIGVALVLAHSPVYVHAGYSGDQYSARQAPIGQIHAGPYIGLGAKI